MYPFAAFTFIFLLICLAPSLTLSAELVALLSWRSKFPHSQYLPRILENIKYVDGGEIVKFLPDTLNCFFEILAENARTYGEYVLGALVSTVDCWMCVWGSMCLVLW